jgi:hypothetical protein
MQQGRRSVVRAGAAVRGFVGAASLGLLLAFASLAGAAAPGTWTEIQGAIAPSPIMQFGTVAGADGSLFVAFANADGDVLVSHASADGSYLSTVTAFPVPPIATTPAGYPMIVRTPDGKLHITYSGERNGVQGVFSGEGSADGSTWSPATLASGDVGGTQIASAVGGDGTVYFAQAQPTVSLHRGLNSAPAQIFQSTEFPQQAGLAVDGSDGSVWLGWMTPPGLTLKIRRADPATGAPSGVEYVAPGVSGAPVSVIYHSPNLQQLAVSGLRSRAGIYAAYVDTADRSTLLLWRVGDPTPKVVVTSPGTVSSTALAAAADGGLWIIWLDSAPAGQTVQTRKLAADGVTLGPIATLAVPPSPFFLSVAQLSGIAQPAGVEIVLAANNGAQRIFATLAVPATSPPPAPPAPPAPPPAAAVVATSLSPKIKVLRRAVSVTLRAPAGAIASGTIQLKAKVTKGKKAKPKIVGSLPFKLAAGQTRTFTVALNKSGRKALARVKRLKVSVIIVARDAAGKAKSTTRIVTLRNRG